MNKILRLNETSLEFDEVEIKNEEVEYDEIKDAVGGYIEHVTFNKMLEDIGVDMWVDEEGKLKERIPVVAVVDLNNFNAVEVLSGSIVFTSKRSSDPEGSYSLSDEQIEVIKKMFNLTVEITHNGSTAAIVRMLPYR